MFKENARKLSRILSLLLVAVLMATVLVGCPAQPVTQAPPAPAAVEPIIIRYATVGPDDHQYTIASRKFKEIIERKSNGRIQVQLFPNAILGGERVMTEGVRMGTIEMTTVTIDGAPPAWVPEAQIFTIPYLFRDNAHAYKAMDGELGEFLAKRFEEQGFILLGFVELGWRHFTNNVREIKSPQDLRGLKIRVMEAPIWMAYINTLGATPTPIPFPELYTALQQGVVDGQENPVRTIRTMKFYEVQRYLTLNAHTYSAGCVLINPAFFRGLSETDQNLIIESVNEMKHYQRRVVAGKAEEDLKYLKEQNMVVTEPDRAKFVEATKGIPYQDTVKRLVPISLVEMVRNIK